MRVNPFLSLQLNSFSDIKYIILWLITWLGPIFWVVVLRGIVSSSFFICWVSLEVSTVIFLVFIKTKTIKKCPEEIIHYFSIQSLARILLLYFWITCSLFHFRGVIILLSLTIKLGVFPFHSWYLNLISILEWNSIWLISGPIKIIVLKLIFTLGIINFLLPLGLLNVLISFLIIFKERKTKIFLGVTSIFNIGWVLVSIVEAITWLIFIFLYILNLIALITNLKFSQSDSLFILPESKNVSQLLLIIRLIIIGIPPLLGFFLKLRVLITLLEERLVFRVLILLASLVIAYYYLILFFFMRLKSRAKKRKLWSDWHGSSYLLVSLNIWLRLIFIFFFVYYINNKE